MEFKRDVSGIAVSLKIHGYQPSRKEDWDSQWCQCDFSFCSGEWLNYRKERDEVFLSREVEELEAALTMLLHDELKEMREISCIEPDFAFFAFPKKDLRTDPRYRYIQPGCEISDIYLKWRVYFWSDGLTDNYLSVTLGREEIVSLRDYLAAVIKKGREG